MKFKYILLLALIFLAIWIWILFMYTAAHELVHQYIFTDFGCESKITIWWRGITTPEEGCYAKQTSEQLQQMNSEHALNDSVGYHLFVFLMFGYVAFLIISIILIKIHSRMRELIKVAGEE